MAEPPHEQNAKGTRKFLGTELFSDDPKMLDKPLLFPNHQRQYKIATWVLTIGLGVYLTLFQDFGKHEHVLSAFRRKVFQFTDQFLKFDSKEEEAVNQQIENIKLKREPPS